MRPAGLLGDQGVLVVVGEQVVGTVDQPGDRGPVHPGHLLRRVGDERVPPQPALVGVPLHGLRVVRGDDHQIQPTHLVGDRVRARSAAPRPSPRCRRSRSGRCRRRWCRRTEPCAAVSDTWTGQVSTPCRSSQARYSPKSSPTAADQQRAQAEGGQPEGHVRRDPAALDLQVLHQEATARSCRAAPPPTTRRNGPERSSGGPWRWIRSRRSARPQRNGPRPRSVRRYAGGL